MRQDVNISDRLDFLGLDQAARATLASLKPLIKSELKNALDQFYAKVRRNAETRRFFKDENHIGSASSRQQQHWDIITQGDFGDDYVKAVRTVGQVHARIGLEPRWYIGGYAIVCEHLVRAVVKAQWPKGIVGGVQKKKVDAAGDALSAIIKAVMLDMDLAISVYLESLDAERARLETEMQKGTAEDERAVAELGAGLKALAEGDLTYRIKADFSNKTAPLKADFNDAIAKLQESLSHVASNTNAIRSGTEEISAAADDLSRRTEQQAASLEETAAALDEITATLRKTSEGANHAREVVGTAKLNAEQSGQVVREAVEAMSGIEKSSDQISQIIGVIDEIAFQTNLLALNAGVEAARAGDAGRGFAVVASEVRALAQRSADAAKEIKALIRASGQQVVRGVDLVGRTGKALEKMVEQVAEINVIVSDIAASAAQQSTGLAEVNTAVNQMDQVTQQNAAMVEETTAASHSLQQETEELSRLIGQFHVGDIAVVEPARASRASGTRTVKKLARAKPVAALRTTGSGGAARKPGTAASDPHEWQEF